MLQHDPAVRAQPIKPQQRAMESAPFEGTTENRDSFVAKPIERTMPIKPKAQTSRADVPPMEFSTTAQENYQPHVR